MEIHYSTKSQKLQRHWRWVAAGVMIKIPLSGTFSALGIRISFRNELGHEFYCEWLDGWASSSFVTFCIDCAWLVVGGMSQFLYYLLSPPITTTTLSLFLSGLHCCCNWMTDSLVLLLGFAYIGTLSVGWSPAEGRKGMDEMEIQLQNRISGKMSRCPLSRHSRNW